jgi:hypothetical protein
MRVGIFKIELENYEKEFNSNWCIVLDGSNDRRDPI